MINNEEHRKVDRTDKVEELTAIWHRDIVGTRRWSIEQIYGPEVAERYSPMLEEREFFIAHGRLPHVEDFRYSEETSSALRFDEWNRSFWDEQRRLHPEKWQAYLDRAKVNRDKWAKLPGNEHEQERLGALQQYIDGKLQELRK